MENKWRAYPVYDGMRVRFISGFLSGNLYGTAHKDPNRGWYVKWDNQTRTPTTTFGDNCGIRDGEVHQVWEIVEQEQTQGMSILNCSKIKLANTSPNSTNCIKCNGPLKDLGMGPQFKFCPICEP